MQTMTPTVQSFVARTLFKKHADTVVSSLVKRAVGPMFTPPIPPAGQPMQPMQAMSPMTQPAPSQPMLPQPASTAQPTTTNPTAPVVRRPTSAIDLGPENITAPNKPAATTTPAPAMQPNTASTAPAPQKPLAPVKPTPAVQPKPKAMGDEREGWEPVPGEEQPSTVPPAQQETKQPAPAGEQQPKQEVKPPAEPAVPATPEQVKVHEQIRSLIERGMSNNPDAKSLLTHFTADSITPEQAKEFLENANGDQQKKLMDNIVNKFATEKLAPAHAAELRATVKPQSFFDALGDNWRALLIPGGLLAMLFGGDIGKLVGGLALAGGVANEFSGQGIVRRISNLTGGGPSVTLGEGKNAKQASIASAAYLSSAKNGFQFDDKEMLAHLQQMAANQGVASPEQQQQLAGDTMQWLKDLRLAVSLGMSDMIAGKVAKQFAEQAHAGIYNMPVSPRTAAWAMPVLDKGRAALNTVQSFLPSWAGGK